MTSRAVYFDDETSVHVEDDDWQRDWGREQVEPAHPEARQVAH